MSITLATMRSRMNTNLQESVTSGYWSNTEKNNYLNMASVMTAGELQWKQSSQTFTLKQFKTFYAVPTDFLIPLRIRDTTNVGGTTTNKIFPGTIAELEMEIPAWRVLGPSNPQKFVFRSSDYLQIVPPPAATYDGTNMTHEYIPVPSTLVNDSDVFDGPLAAAEAVIELASAFCLFKYDLDKARARMQKWWDRLKKARSDWDRDQMMKSFKWRIAGRFEKAHHSYGFRRIFPFGIHY